LVSNKKGHDYSTNPCLFIPDKRAELKSSVVLVWTDNKLEAANLNVGHGKR
jgi:hypothetical protein